MNYGKNLNLIGILYRNEPKIYHFYNSVKLIFYIQSLFLKK